MSHSYDLVSLMWYESQAVLGPVNPYDQAPMTPRDEGEDGHSRLFEQKLSALGERVRAIRRSREWSQLDFASRTGLGRPKVSEIESGKHNLTLEALWRLADALEVHWADLIDDRKTVAPRGQEEPAPFARQLKAFGTRVYQARVLQRLSQQALTSRTRIGRSAVSEIEEGRRNITLGTLFRLAAGLGVHWADLIDDRKTTPPQPAPPGE
jgi:transcriptional regulator with XRE-family HTH domain